MELPDHVHLTPGDPRTTLAGNAHPMPRMGTRDKQTLSITPIHFLRKFQQGCETNDRNIASNEQNQQSFQTRKSLPSQDQRNTEISHRPYLDKNNLMMIKQGYISPIKQEWNIPRSPKTGKIKTVQFQDEEIEIRHDNIESHQYPLITEKINHDSYRGNNFSGIQKSNIHQRSFQQGNNYFHPIMQHNNNSPSNNEETISKQLSQNQAIQNNFIDQSTSPATSSDPEGQINATSLHDYIKQNISTFQRDSNMEGIISEIHVHKPNRFNLKDNPFIDPNSNHFPNISINTEKEEEEKQSSKIVFNTESDTHYKGVSGRYYSPKAPVYSALFLATTSLPLGLRHPIIPTTNHWDQENSIPNAIKRMNQEAIQAERQIINKTSTKSLQEVSIMVDQNIDNIHILNDHQLRCQGAIIIPFKEEDTPTPLYVGAFEIQGPNQAKMWVCKPCDAMVFRKSNFKTHHRSDRHSENLKIWSGRVEQLPIIQKEEIDIKHRVYRPSLVDLEQAIISIETMIPLKYRKEATAMTSIFFNKYLAKEDEIDLIQNFKEAKDPTILDQDQRHWINKKFEALRQKEDPREYMKTKWKSRAVMIRRTAEQKEEIEPIADLARALFATLINYEFIPIKYLMILAIIMNRRNRLNYPDSATTLSNGFYIDLFISPGSIIEYTRKNESKENLDIQRIAINENPEEMMFGEFYPENNEEFQNLFIQEPIMQDIQEQIKYDAYDHTTNPDNNEWTLDQASQSTASSSSSSSYSIPSLMIPKNNSESSSYSSSSSSIPSMMSHPIDKITLSNSSSSCSIPALIVHPEENKTSMEQGTNYQSQVVKRRTTNTIYVTNLKQGITKEELMKLFANCGGDIKEITKDKFESTKALIKFDHHEAADKAVATLHNSIFCGLPLSVCRAHHAGREPLDKNKAMVEDQKEQELIQQYLSSSSSSSYSDSFEEENITEQPPTNNDTVTLELNHFNSQSLQIVPMQDILLPPYTTTSFKARIVRHDNRNFEIKKGRVSLTCGPAPCLQIMDGIYPVTESLLTPSARNNSPYTICIPKGRIIQGTSCHLDKYITNKLQNTQEGWPAFHLQSKTFHYMNHMRKTSYEWNGANYLLEDMNPWIMDVDTQ